MTRFSKREQEHWEKKRIDIEKFADEVDNANKKLEERIKYSKLLIKKNEKKIRKFKRMV